MIVAKIKNSLVIVSVFFYSFIFTQKKMTENFQNIKRDTVNFIYRKVDLNQDSKPDILFYNKWFKGNEMYFFTNRDGKYIQSLKTINFSSDASYKIEKIEPVDKNKNNVVLRIHTILYNKEDVKAIHYISYKNNHWYLQKTEYNAIIFDHTNDKLLYYKCVYMKNIILSEKTTLEIFNPKDKNCIKVNKF